MPIREKPWPAGAPCWTDLTVPDVPAAQAFYNAALGWDFAASGDEREGYVMARVTGRDAAGIGPSPVTGMPSSWTLYLASDDADATASTVTEHGGAVLLEPGDVSGLGRMLLAADPTGAPFGVWQAGTHIGCTIVDEPGALVWQDLQTSEPETARAFYRDVFGHRSDAVPGAPESYQTVSLPDATDRSAPLAGIGPFMGDDAGQSPSWIVYFGVPDTTAALAAVSAGGGTVLTPPMDTPFGVMATVADPFGAVFTVMGGAPLG